MSTKTEAQVLADAYESVRNLSKFYLSKVDGFDTEQCIVSGETKFNSAHWIAAHLVWTEHFLLIQGLRKESLDIPWLGQYGFGSKPEDIKSKPDFKEVLAKLDEVHRLAVKNILELSDEEIEKENAVNAAFGGVNNKRNIIKHAIRHEPMHIGQLSWILKANGIEMV